MLPIVEIFRDLFAKREVNSYASIECKERKSIFVFEKLCICAHSCAKQIFQNIKKLKKSFQTSLIQYIHGHKRFKKYDKLKKVEDQVSLLICNRKCFYI